MKIKKSIIFSFSAAILTLLFSQQIMAWKWYKFYVQNDTRITVYKIFLYIECKTGTWGPKYYERYAYLQNKKTAFRKSLPYSIHYDSCWISNVRVWKKNKNNKIVELPGILWDSNVSLQPHHNTIYIKLDNAEPTKKIEVIYRGKKIGFFRFNSSN